MISKAQYIANSKKHLVVLSHGIIGSSRDLSYLEEKLVNKGFTVLQSSSNELHGSLFGVSEAARKLRDEVVSFASRHRDLETISFVGNSLGGLFARYAIMLLYNPDNQTILGLLPKTFLTIATPHLGVREHTFIEDYNLPKPPFAVKKFVSQVLLQSGKDLFGTDQPEFRQSLIYQMATDPTFIDPLQSFQKRRLYANVHLDFVVPLGTAAMLTQQEVQQIREKYEDREGIVEIIYPSSTYPIPINSKTTVLPVSDDNIPKEESDYREMLHSLNSVGWEKVLVRFSGVFPSAHNKICAMTRFSDIIDEYFGFPEGQFVMDDAAEWIGSVLEPSLATPNELSITK